MTHPRIPVSPAPSRRSVLGMVPALAIAAIPALPTAPQPNDADLLALLRQVDDLEAQWSASVDISSGLPNCSPEMAHYEAHEDELRARRNALVEKANDMPTRSLAGFRARARSILQQSYGDIDDGYRGQLTALLEHLAAVDLARHGSGISANTDALQHNVTTGRQT